MKRTELAGDVVFTVADVLDEAACERFVGFAEAEGFDAAAVNTVHRPDLRNNDRVLVDRPDWAQQLWDRLRPVVPETLLGFQRPVGLNERFRFYRYRRGQRFRPHRDGYWEDERGRSTHTVLLFLSEDFEGGETRIYDGDLRVKPRIGTALFFHHQLLHEGCPVGEGTKYVLRTDLICRRIAP